MKTCSVVIVFDLSSLSAPEGTSVPVTLSWLPKVFAEGLKEQVSE